MTRGRSIPKTSDNAESRQLTATAVHTGACGVEDEQTPAEP